MGFYIIIITSPRAFALGHFFIHTQYRTGGGKLGKQIDKIGFFAFVGSSPNNQGGDLFCLYPLK